MKKIITLTLNPAFDLHYKLDRFETGKENYVKNVIFDAGGKGINISRALKTNGYQSAVYVVLGEENGDAFEKNLREYSLDYVAVRSEGRIRENITLHPLYEKETRISFDSFCVSPDIAEKLVLLAISEMNEDTLVSFSGRIPKGLPKEKVTELLLEIKNTGAKVAVDSNSMLPADLKLVCPWFIKPNEQEIAGYIGREISSDKDAAECAVKLVKEGVSEQVMISMGSRGSVWSDGVRSYKIKAVPILNPISTIGAGDSTIAGYLAGCADGKDIKEALRLACAFGTAACLTEGTLPPQKEEVNRLLSEITVEDI